MSKLFAISSSGKTEKSFLDLRFGKCENVVLYDQSTGDYSVIENQFKNTDHSGEQLVKLLKQKGVSVVITGEVGPKASSALQKEELQLVLLNEEKIKVEEVIQRLKNKRA